MATCEYCGTTFEVKYPRNRNRFCSNLCKMRGIAKARPSRGSPSEETRRKIREAQLGKFIPADQRAKMSAAHKGVPLSETHRANLKAALPRGERHPAWKGSAVGYPALHSWLTRHYGKTGICERCGAQPKRTEWANVTGRYDREDRSNWSELCVACHRREDGANPKRPAFEGSA